jgi:pyruvate dehydrogenase E1 component alpha subunit
MQGIIWGVTSRDHRERLNSRKEEMPEHRQIERRPSGKWLLEQWTTMLRIRRAEEAVAQLIDSGEARCPCHLSIGQEAVAAGVCAALGPADTVWGGHRSHGHYLAKGGSLEQMLAEILGKSTGCSGGRGGSMHLLALEQGILGTVPIVAGTVPLAAGAAMAYKMRKEPRVAVAFFGDGTLEEGHVHEAMNLAALYRLPVVFLCENNLYSSHLHWSERRVSDNLERAGEFHSMPSAGVDGNDVAAVFEAASTAVERARVGEGPSFLACRTFRWRGHVGSSCDVDVGVKRRGELEAWLGKDPIRRVAARLGGIYDLDESVISEEIRRALERARAAPLPPPGRVFQHVFAEAPCGS